MSVSVIIPLYNGEPWIGQALDSVFTQELSAEKVIVVDDGSTDASVEIVCNDYPKVKLIPNEGKGSSIARNIGLGEVSTKYVAFLDQDDLWHPSHLRLLVNSLEQNPEANTAVAEANCFSGDTPNYQLSNAPIRFFDSWTRYPFTIGIDGPSLALHRTDILPTVGLWEECATGMGDALIFLKLAVLHPILRISACTVGKRIHDSQQWLAVRELGGTYLGFRYQVMQRALEFRRHHVHSSTDLQHYERRLESLISLKNLNNVIEAESFEELPPIALELESLIGTESVEYLPHAFYCLMGALFKTHDAEELRKLRDEVFTRLLDYWPEDAPATLNAMRGIIGELPHVS
ncbi:MAG: glycosyltransferase family 2 protein [Nostoc sp.]